MPGSPCRRSIVLNNLINSPCTRKHLEDRGVINNEKVVRQIQVSEAVVESIKSSVKEVKKKGTISSDKHKANRLLYHVVLRSAGKYHTFGSAISNYLRLRRGKKDNKQPEWWKTKQRKPRKDKVN